MSDSMKLLTEWTALTYDPREIKEAMDRNGGKIMLKGILQRANTVNQNGRIYPRSVLEREVMNHQKFIRENRALGECDHPESSVIELKNASHIVREAHMEGDDVFGVVELLETPSGQILKSLVSSGVTLEISSRGVGSTKSQAGNQIVQDDFQLICFDMVSEPSTPGAFMMREGKNFTPRDLDKTFKKSDRINRMFNDVLMWRR